MTGTEQRLSRANLRRNLKEYLDLDASAELPESHDLRFARTTVFTLLAAISLLLFWSSKTPVSEIAVGRGTIKTELEIERIEHPFGGQVREIVVTPGHRVEQGAHILSFETTGFENEIEKLKANLEALEAERARFQFVLKGELPDGVALESLQENSESTMFWVEQAYHKSQLDLIEAGREAIRSRLVSLVAQREKLEAEARLLKERLERSKTGAARGALSINDLQEQERQVLQAERGVLALLANIAAERHALNESSLIANELVATRKREAAVNTAEIDAQIAGIKLSIEEATQLVERSDVYATIAGTVMSLGVVRANEVVGAGELIAEIIPESGETYAEIELPAEQIGDVERGSEVRLKVDAFDFTRFGELVGRVADVSPTSFASESGDVVYRVVVAFDQTGGLPELNGRLLRPGMTVTAEIIKESKSVLTYLLKPLRLLKDRAFTEA